MSVLQYSDALNAPDIQVWDNAAFVDDHGESEVTTWSSLKPDLVNLSESLQSDDCSKENRSPNGAIGNAKSKTVKISLKESLLESMSPVSKASSKEENGRDIDAEIEEIEKEIFRLSSRLEALRLEKLERNAKTVERPRGRIIPAKFMEPKQIMKDMDTEKKSEGTVRMTRRGVSLGPAEIASSFKSRPLSKAEITPVMSVQSRRKSCFWKLQEIDELKVTKERRKSLSNSPASRKTAAKTQPQRHALTTVGSKKGAKKEDGLISSIQPKKLFKDGEKSAPTKKSAKPGRIVASRYNQMTVSAARKRSWPENDKDESERFDKKRVSQGTESKVKKRWEIPSELILYKSEEEDKNKKGSSETPLTISRVSDVLPKIRTARCVDESPRDSGRAKRAAELVGRKGYFDETEGLPFCQALSFIEDVEEEEC